MIWTDASVDRLKSLLAAGLHDGDIAKQFFVSRAAITGKRFRLNLPANPMPPTAVSLVAKRRMEVRRLAALEPASLTNGVGFMDRMSGECTFPLWVTGSRPSLDEMRFCGASVEIGQPYCPRCCAITYQGGQRPATQVTA